MILQATLVMLGLWACGGEEGTDMLESFPVPTIPRPVRPDGPTGPRFSCAAPLELEGAGVVVDTAGGAPGALDLSACGLPARGGPPQQVVRYRVQRGDP